MQYWIYLFFAIVLEVAGTTSMKLSEGFSKLIPSAFIFIFYGAAFIPLTLALKKIDIGVAYAVWSGVGMALIAIIGILHFREPATALKLVSLGLVILGVVGLNLSETSH